MLNAANARIFGSDLDTVHVAPYGTALPTDLSALGPAYVDAGWLHSDGIPFTPSDNVTQLRGHQGGRVVRTVINESGLAFSFQCLETTLLTLGLQHNILEQSVTSGVARLRASAGRKVERRVFVVDLYDIDDTSIHYRYVIQTGEIGERSEFTHANSDITGYTFPVEIIGEYIVYTNDPAVVSSGAGTVFTVAVEGTGGTFAVAVGSGTTSGIAYNATSSAVETAIRGTIDGGGATVSGSAGGPYTVTLAETNTLGVDGSSLTGPDAGATAVKVS